MEKSNLRVADSAAGFAVDQLHALRSEGFERCRDIRYCVGDVMESRAFLGQEFANRSVIGEGFQEFDVSVTNIQEHCLHTLLGDLFAVHRWHTERLLVKLDGRIQIRHGNPYVVNTVEHPWGV